MEWGVEWRFECGILFEGSWGLAWAHCVAHVPRVCAGVKGGPRTILLVARNCLARMKCPLPLSARAEQGLFSGHTRPCSLRAGAPTPESSAHVPRIPPSVKGGPRTRRLVASNCLARTGCRKRRPTWGRGGLDPLPLSARACVCSEQGLFSGHPLAYRSGILNPFSCLLRAGGPTPGRGALSDWHPRYNLRSHTPTNRRRHRTPFHQRDA